jgi:hypothetical protein
MNITQLERICLVHLFEVINPENVIPLFVEANDTPVLERVKEICYDYIAVNFASISKSENFCSLPQDLMLNIIQNVIPTLGRIESTRIANDDPEDDRVNITQSDFDIFN